MRIYNTSVNYGISIILASGQDHLPTKPTHGMGRWAFAQDSRESGKGSLECSLSHRKAKPGAICLEMILNCLWRSVNVQVHCPLMLDRKQEISSLTSRQ